MPQVIDVPGMGQVEFPDGMSDEQIVAAIQQNSPQQAQPAQPSASALDYAKAVPETLAHLASGAVAGPVAGYAGMATMLGNRLGVTNANPADVVNSVQQGLTYEPKTAQGQSLTSAVTYPFRKYGEGANWAGDKVRQGVQALGGSAEQAALAGTEVNTGIQALPMLLGLKYGQRAAISKAPKQVAPEVQQATDAGLSLTPRMGGGMVGKAAEGLANSAKLERAVSVKNAPVVDQGVLQQIGLPADTKITPANIEAAKGPYNAVYEKVAQLPPVTPDKTVISQIKSIPERSGMGVNFPGNVAELKKNYVDQLESGTPQTTQALLDEVRQLRKESAGARRGPYDPARIAEATAKRKIADALEAQIDRHIKATSDAPPDLYPQYKEAQKQLAVIESAKKAVRGRHFDARLLAKQAQKGVPLSGPMKTYATAFDNFDRALQNPSRLRNTGPFDALDAVIGAGAGMAHPGFVAGILGRPLIRNALASSAYQKNAIAGSFGFQIPYSLGVLPPAVEQSRLNYDPRQLPSP